MPAGRWRGDGWRGACHRHAEGGARLLDDLLHFGIARCEALGAFQRDQRALREAGPEQRLALAEQVVGVVRLLAQQALVQGQRLLGVALPGEHARQQKACVTVLRCRGEMRLQRLARRVQALLAYLAFGLGDAGAGSGAVQRERQPQGQASHRRVLSRRRMRASSSSGWNGLVT